MILQGDCLEKMKELESNSVDAIVTDPPYGLSFMGKHWDYDVPSVEIWKEALRVLKPGGYLLSFAGTRTQHRMAVNIEDAGFEIRDMIAWVYGSGFPKSLNIGKAVDKLQGNEREDLGLHPQPGTAGKTHTRDGGAFKDDIHITKGTSEWEGWGTALKPALEPITVARKPLSENTVAENVLKWGTGGINIDGSRVSGEMGADRALGKPRIDTDKYGKANPKLNPQSPLGRFPANFIHDGSDEVVGLFPNSNSAKVRGVPFQKEGGTGSSFVMAGQKSSPQDYGDKGSASRFFYCAKASKSERNRGCEELEEKQTVGGGGGIGDYLDDVNSASGKYGSEKAPSKNNHPTVKPIALMEYLVKLVSKPDAIVLDPFAGSGSTLVACKNLGRKYIGIEREAEYIKIIEKRLEGLTQNSLGI